MTDPVPRRWRDYRTETGRRPVREFMDALPVDERAEVVAAMKEVAIDGRKAARHLRGEIYEVRAETARASYRVLFATQGAREQVLLSLSAFEKKTQKTPVREIELAERRLADWRARA